MALRWRLSPAFAACGLSALLVLGSLLLTGCKGNPQPDSNSSTRPSGLPGSTEPHNVPQPGSSLSAIELTPDDAMLFAHVRFGELWNSDLVKAFRAIDVPGLPKQAMSVIEQLLGFSLDDVHTFTLVMGRPENLQAEPDGYAVVVMNQDLKQLQKLKLVMQYGKVQTFQARTYYIAGSAAMYFFNDRTLISGSQPSIERFLARLDKPVDRQKSRFTRAFKAVEESHHIVVVGFPPAEMMARIAKEGLPKELELLKPILEAKAAFLTLRFEKGFQLHIDLDFPDDASAVAAEKAAQDALVELRKAWEQEKKKHPVPEEALVPLEKAMDKMLDRITVKRKGTTLHADAVLELDPAALTAMIPSITKLSQQAANMLQNHTNMREIAIALHNYHADFKGFPLATYGNFSWRLHLIPYLEGNQSLESLGLKPNEPWDSEHNLKVAKERMPKILAPAGRDAPPGMTYYRAFTGPGTIFATEGKPVTLTQITNFDGTSNTILLVETDEPVFWTNPVDMPYDLKKPLPKMGGLYSNPVFIVCLADGKIAYVPKDAKEDAIRAAITWNDGKAVPLPEK